VNARKCDEEKKERDERCGVHLFVADVKIVVMMRKTRRLRSEKVYRNERLC
jgi:hypothetical protein